MLSSPPCLLSTWQSTQPALFRWLLKQSHQPDLAFDLLQETFLKALKQQRAFCDIENQRAWLFRVAANLLRDEQRRTQKWQTHEDIDETTLVDNNWHSQPVDDLVACLPKALRCLCSSDRDILQRCDIDGMTQATYAEQNHLPLSTVKSRIQRARTHLRRVLKQNCQIRFDDNQHVCCFTPAKPRKLP